MQSGKGNRAKRWDQEYNIHTAIKLLYELEFRHHISTSRIVMNIMKSVSVTKTNVHIFIFLFTIDWVLPRIYLPTFQFKKKNNSTAHIAVFVPSTISSIFLFSYRPLSCIFCLQIYYFYSFILWHVIMSKDNMFIFACF